MALKLEAFDACDGPAASDLRTDDADAESARLAAYEQGYNAGWEDSAATASSDQSRQVAEVARNLQALSFTFHEARTHVLQSLKPLLVAVVDRLLPEISRDALAPLVLETLMPIAEDIAAAPVTIVLNPAARPAVEALLAGAAGLPVNLREEPTLGEGQVHLVRDETETRIDLDRAITEIATAMHSFFGYSGRERRNG